MIKKLDKNYYQYETNVYRGNISGRKLHYGHQTKRRIDDYTGNAEPNPAGENAVRHLEDNR